MVIPTGTDPRALIDACARFSRDFPLQGAAVGSFGPCDVDPGSPTYGHILSTPKPGWAGVDVRGLFQQALRVPVTLTTDVMAAALGEVRLGAGRQAGDLVYLTIGTGIGGGVTVGGDLLFSAQHPEMGHILLPQSGPDGVCPFHGGCFEGLASGPAMLQRLGRAASELADEDPAWDVQARIVAAGLHNIVCTLAPRMIVLGGGVGSRKALHDRLPALLEESLAGYLPVPVLRRPGLGADSGVVGALLLAQSQG